MNVRALLIYQIIQRKLKKLGRNLKCDRDRIKKELKKGKIIVQIEKGNKSPNRKGNKSPKRKRGIKVQKIWENVM